MAASGTIDQERVRSLADASSGMLVLPDDDAYDAARTIHNASIDRRPALIVRCLGTADVVAAVAFARESGLEVSVRRGGHNVAGRAVSDGGVMIDLSLMKGIHVDPRARTARAQGGRPGASSTGRRPSTGSRRRAASSRPPASPGSRSAAGSVG